MVKKNKVYDIVTKKPVARFYYQGNHSHPIRRTILVISETNKCLVGYELREGKIIRTLAEAKKHIKSYRKDSIARWGDYSRLQQSMQNWHKNPKSTTLERFPITAIIAAV